MRRRCCRSALLWKRNYRCNLRQIYLRGGLNGKEMLEVAIEMTGEGTAKKKFQNILSQKNVIILFQNVHQSLNYYFLPIGKYKISNYANHIPKFHKLLQN